MGQLVAGGLSGVLSIVLGILLFMSPAQGGLALLWTIGVYAIVFGVMLLVLGVRMATSGGHGTTSGHAAVT